MHFFSTIVLLATTVAAIAIPSEAVPSVSLEYSSFTVEQTGAELDIDVFNNGTTVAKRGTVGVYFCTNNNFGGSCLNFWPESGVCYNLGGWTDTISSIGPNSGVTCNLYDSTGCSTGEGSINNMVYPGFTDLRNIAHPPNKANWNDCISSIVCW